MLSCIIQAVHRAQYIKYNYREISGSDPKVRGSNPCRRRAFWKGLLISNASAVLHNGAIYVKLLKIDKFGDLKPTNSRVFKLYKPSCKISIVTIIE